MVSALAIVPIFGCRQLERFGGSQERKMVGFGGRAGRQLVDVEEQPLVLDADCM